MEPREQINIKELVGAALAGDSGAYETLYNATAAQMLGLTRSMLRQEEDALDALQESYLYAFKSLGSLQQPEHFRTWLYSIVSNRCKNFLTRTRPKLFAASLTDEEGDNWEIEDGDLSFQPQESVEYSETQRIVWEMVDTLPEDQRACVLLYYFQEMKVVEIARLLEVSENTVKSRLGYARKKLLIKAEELERKGTVLHGFAFFPLMALAARQAVGQSMAAGGAVMAQSIVAELGVTGVTAGTAAAATASAGSAASGTGSASAIQTFLGTAAGKAAAGAAVVLLVTTGILLFPRQPEPKLPAEPEVSIVEIDPEPVAESIPEPEPEPEPTPPTPYSEWEGSVPDIAGAPLDEYSLTVRISGNVEVYETDLGNGDIYIRLSVGDEFTIELTEVSGNPKSYQRRWSIGKASKLLKQIEADTFVKIYQGEKAGSATLTAFFSDQAHSVTTNIHVTVS